MLLGGEKLLDRGKYSKNSKRFDFATQIKYGPFILTASMHTSCDMHHNVFFC